MAGFGRYYWRGFVDKTDGNYLVIFALPTLLHQDERYYAMGKGGLWKRTFYAASRIAVTPNYDGHNSFNVSELLGRGVAQGVSLAYYPSGTRTVGAVASKYGYAIGRDALTNVFREFWPDIAGHCIAIRNSTKRWASLLDLRRHRIGICSASLMKSRHPWCGSKSIRRRSPPWT